jgi:hypothetical protein
VVGMWNGWSQTRKRLGMRKRLLRLAEHLESMDRRW